jgi:hypothetical protein
MIFADGLRKHGIEAMDVSFYLASKLSAIIADLAR